MSRQVLLIDGPYAGEMLPLPASGVISYEDPPADVAAYSASAAPTAVLPERRFYTVRRYALVGLVNVGTVEAAPSDADVRRMILQPRAELLLERPPFRIDPASIPVWTMGEREAMQVACACLDAAAHYRVWRRFCRSTWWRRFAWWTCGPARRCSDCQARAAHAADYDRMAEDYRHVAANSAMVVLPGRVTR